MSRMVDMKAVYEAKGLTQAQIDNIEECFARADKAQLEFETVSYTHLDVYKRQDEGRTSG